jgi:tetratricopeptide (TPR) repeat protein
MNQTPTFYDAPLYIGGERRTSSANEMMDNFYPATGERLCRVHVAAPEDIEAAVVAAKRGFAVWSKMHLVERGRILRRAAEIIRSRQRVLAEVEVYDTGKPITEGRHDEALAAGEKAIALSPSSAGAYHMAGMFHGYAGDFRKSAEYEQQAQRLSPLSRNESTVDEARARFHLGDLVAARDIASRVLIEKPRWLTAQTVLDTGKPPEPPPVAGRRDILTATRKTSMH